LSATPQTPAPALSGLRPPTREPRISLITSVCRAAEHIDQLLENTTRQTVFSSWCEWIIIDVNPPGFDREARAIASCMERHPGVISYSRLDHDPGVYGVWNLALRRAAGEFVTTVNCDDRRLLHALESQATFLSAHPECGLVYCDSFISPSPNPSWTVIPAGTLRYAFEEFSPRALLRRNLPHCNPMWRRSLHERHGYFDERYRSAGDWEFWLRCVSNGEQFIKHPETLGIYHRNPTGISTDPRHADWKRAEEREVAARYARLDDRPPLRVQP